MDAAMRRGVIVGALACTVLAGVAVTVEARGLFAIGKPDLQGQFNVYPEASIRLKLKPSRSHPLFIEIRDFPLRCNDGTTRPLSGLFKSEIQRDGTFRHEIHSTGSFGATGITYVDIAGKLKRRSARGTFYTIDAPFQSPGPSCGTPGPAQWKARAVKRR